MPNLPDLGLETLLDLNGIVYRLSKGYWVKFEAYLVSQTAQIPHGVSYSITLHDRNNTRVLGFDNAHGTNPRGRKKFSGRKVSWDHKHRYEKVIYSLLFVSFVAKKGVDCLPRMTRLDSNNDKTHYGDLIRGA